MIGPEFFFICLPLLQGFFFLGGLLTSSSLDELIMCISGGSVLLALGFTLYAFFLDVFLKTGMELCQNTDKNWNGIFICAKKI